MRGLVRFVRKRGWHQVAMLLVGVAAIIGAGLWALLGKSLVSPYIVVSLLLVGAILIILAFVCLVIGPSNESPDAEDVAQVGLEVPPETPVRLPKGVPRGTKVHISASEELVEDEERSGNDKPPDP